MAETPPPAPALGVRLGRLHAEVDGWEAGTVEVDLEDVQAALAHIDAQATRLATFQEAYQAIKAKLMEEETIADAQAARLEALEAAARPVAAYLAVHPEWDNEFGHGCKLCGGWDDDYRQAIEHDAHCPLQPFLDAVGAPGEG